VYIFIFALINMSKIIMYTHTGHRQKDRQTGARAHTHAHTH